MSIPVFPHDTYGVTINRDIMNGWSQEALYDFATQCDVEGNPSHCARCVAFVLWVEREDARSRTSLTYMLLDEGIESDLVSRIHRVVTEWLRAQ